MPQTFGNQFPPEFYPPLEIIELIGFDALKDESWDGDACPSFRIAYDDKLVLWCEPEAPENREFPDHKRFRITRDENAPEDPHSTDNEPVIFKTNSITKVVEYILNLQ